MLRSRSSYFCVPIQSPAPLDCDTAHAVKRSSMRGPFARHMKVQPLSLTSVARRVCAVTSLAIFSSLGTFTSTAEAQTNAAAPYRAMRIGDEGLAISSQTPATGLPDLRGTSAPDALSSTFEADRDKLYAELADDFTMVDRLGNLVKRVATLVKPSVIHIEARKTEKTRGRTESFDEAGSGVVIAIGNERWVLTNRHVIVNAPPNQILIRTNDGREIRPTKVLSDPSTDVAIMRIDAPVPTARIGDSRSVEIGDFVLAIGSPFGLSHSVTFGILSAKGRRDLTLGTERIELQDFFQTDAAINPGNSGGPLLNLRGEVIAVNTAIASSSGGSEGIGFAIPIEMAVRVAEELVAHGKLRRGYLGVTLDPEFTADDAMRGSGFPGGALVKEVRDGSPAALANLLRGDVILEFNGVGVDNDDHLVTRVGLTPLGEEVPVIISRNGRRYRTNIVVVPMP
jgi:serine protease Do